MANSPNSGGEALVAEPLSQRIEEISVRQSEHALKLGGVDRGQTHFENKMPRLQTILQARNLAELDSHSVGIAA